MLPLQCLQPICSRPGDLDYPVQAFPAWPQFTVVWVFGGLVHCFKDQFTDLEASGLYQSVEMLRDPLLESYHVEVGLIPFLVH